MSSATTATAMASMQAVGVFVVIPLLICLVIALAVYAPVWRRRRRDTGTFRAREADAPLTSGVLLNKKSSPGATGDDEVPR